jgi:hypothetical protein
MKKKKMIRFGPWGSSATTHRQTFNFILFLLILALRSGRTTPMAHGSCLATPMSKLSIFFDGFWSLEVVELPPRATGVVRPPPKAKAHHFFFFFVLLPYHPRPASHMVAKGDGPTTHLLFFHFFNFF